MKKLCLKLECLNLSRILADHLIGEAHTDKHRKRFGIMIMGLGVGLVKSSMLIDVSVVHFIAEMAGFAIRAIGVLPFISPLEKQNNHGTNKSNTECIPGISDACPAN